MKDSKVSFRYKLVFDLKFMCTFEHDKDKINYLN